MHTSTLMMTLTLGPGRATAETTVIAETANARAVEKYILKVHLEAWSWSSRLKRGDLLRSMAVELNLANAVVKRALGGEGSPRYIEVRLVGRSLEMHWELGATEYMLQYWSAILLNSNSVYLFRWVMLQICRGWSITCYYFVQGILLSGSNAKSTTSIFSRATRPKLHIK